MLVEDSQKKERLPILPLVIFVIFCVALFFSAQYTGRKPAIDELNPKIGIPGEILVISGSGFGDSRERSNVEIAGNNPTGTSYLEWSDSRISVKIPENVSSGLVYVTTPRGSSQGALFTNRNHIPVVVQGAVSPGLPHIASVEPAKASVGDIITIRGSSFGDSADSGRVFFSWGAEGDSISAADSILSKLVAASELEKEYLEWSDELIRLQVADGAETGNIFVSTEKGMSNALFFEIDQRAGSKIFNDKKTYALEYGVDITNVAAVNENILYVWLPLIPNTASQRNIQLIDQTVPEYLRDYNGLILYRLDNLETGDELSLRHTFLFDNYAVRTKIDPASLKTNYDTSSQLYKVYTRDLPGFESIDANIRTELKRAVSGNLSLYKRAEAIYRYVIEAYSVNSTQTRNSASVVVGNKRGNAWEIASFFGGLCRSAGLITRNVSGYLLSDDYNVHEHFWLEIFFPGFGWFPVDPVLAIRGKFSFIEPGVMAKDFYWGNLTNSHVALGRGQLEAKQIHPQGKLFNTTNSVVKQSVYEESVGNITFRSQRTSASLLGIY